MASSQLYLPPSIEEEPTTRRVHDPLVEAGAWCEPSGLSDLKLLRGEVPKLPPLAPPPRGSGRVTMESLVDGAPAQSELWSLEAKPLWGDASGLPVFPEASAIEARTTTPPIALSVPPPAAAERAPNFRSATPGLRLGGAALVTMVAALFGFQIIKGNTNPLPLPTGNEPAAAAHAEAPLPAPAEPLAQAAAEPEAKPEAKAEGASDKAEAQAGVRAKIPGFGMGKLTTLQEITVRGEAPSQADKASAGKPSSADEAGAKGEEAKGAKGEEAKGAHTDEAKGAKGEEAKGAKGEEAKAEAAAPAEAPPFDRAAAAAVLSGKEGEAKSCWSDGDPHGLARVSVTFSTSGRATQVRVDGDFSGTKVGSCLAGRFRGLQIPSFSGEAVTVVKRVHLP